MCGLQSASTRGLYSFVSLVRFNPCFLALYLTLCVRELVLRCRDGLEVGKREGCANVSRCMRADKPPVCSLLGSRTQHPFQERLLRRFVVFSYCSERACSPLMPQQRTSLQRNNIKFNKNEISYRAETRFLAVLWSVVSLQY